MRSMLVMLTTLALVAGAAATRSLADPDESAIKTAMKTAMAGNGLLKKVASGTATDDQKQELLRQFQNLSAAQPPHGDAASWKAKTDQLVAAARSAVADKADAPDQLKKAANCAACHAAHRGQ